MGYNIITKNERVRGCGYRKPGGLYMVTDGKGKPCGRLPMELSVCPCCNQGIKPSRGFTWVLGSIFQNSTCNTPDHCTGCQLETIKENKLYGLIWVGEKFYKRPLDFTREAVSMGISRRIPAVPNDFVIGKTWVFLAHRKAMVEYDDDNQPIFKPGVFYSFRPTRIEYVVKGTETEEELERMADRGITLVKVNYIKPKQGSIEDVSE